MLAVINRVAGSLIGERIGPPAQERTAFEQQDPPSCLSQIDGGGEAGEAAPDNQDKGTRGQGDKGIADFRTHLLVSSSPCPPGPLSPCPPVSHSLCLPVALAHSLNAMRNRSGLCNLIRLLKTS